MGGLIMNTIYTSPAFREWLKDVDCEILRQTGIGLFDLPDQTWALWFEEGYGPEEAAILALEASSYPMESIDPTKREFIYRR